MYTEENAWELNSCPECGIPITVVEQTYPERDIAHYIPCPWCKVNIVKVSKGTKDIDILKRH